MRVILAIRDEEGRAVRAKGLEEDDGCLASISCVRDVSRLVNGVQARRLHALQLISPHSFRVNVSGSP